MAVATRLECDTCEREITQSACGDVVRCGVCTEVLDVLDCAEEHAYRTDGSSLRVARSLVTDAVNMLRDANKYEMYEERDNALAAALSMADMAYKNSGSKHGQYHVYALAAVDVVRRVARNNPV